MSVVQNVNVCCEWVMRASRVVETRACVCVVFVCSLTRVSVCVENLWSLIKEKGLAREGAKTRKGGRISFFIAHRLPEEGEEDCAILEYRVEEEECVAGTKRGYDVAAPQQLLPHNVRIAKVAG